MILSITFYTYLKDPALLAERTQSPGSKNQKAWDKYLVIAIYIIALSWLIIMPLDARRFLWSPVFPLWIKLFGGVVLLPSIYLIVSATVENTYLSTLVRIQDDRKQHVISTGIYSFVRHPLYLGCFLMMFAAPLLLGSVLGLIISVIGFIAIIGRIIGEEAMLTIELEGYEDYKKKVIYRLIPYIW
jgi:protein-S-isoprenylcysteine O-methyltransferase Ste14